MGLGNQSLIQDRGPMPIYGIKDLNFSKSGADRPMTLKLGMQHWESSST